MRFDLNDEQRAIKQAVHELCEARFDPAALAGDKPRDDPFWPELTKSGWSQLAVPQRFGGQGAGLLELTLVLEELGYALAPAGFLGNAAACVLVGAASDAQQERWLPAMASGERRAAFGQARGRGAVLLDAKGASLAVVAGDLVADVMDPLPELRPAEPLDVTRQVSRIEMHGGERLGGDLQAALDRAEVRLAAELVGVAQHAMELAVEHAQHRQQFGRPIGAYQAVSHRCADMLVLVESARSAVLSAAWTADHAAESLPFAASVAKVAAATAAWQVCASSLQVHGGMGFTWEHPIHLFMRRAAATTRLLGSVDEHLDRIAAQNGLGQRDAAGVAAPREAVPVAG